MKVGSCLGVGESTPSYGVPDGIRTRVLALKGPRPRPLDDGDAWSRATNRSMASRRLAVTRRSVTAKSPR